MVEEPVLGYSQASDGSRMKAATDDRAFLTGVLQFGVRLIETQTYQRERSISTKHMRKSERSSKAGEKEEERRGQLRGSETMRPKEKRKGKA